MKTEFDRQALDYSKYRPNYPEALFEHLTSLCPARELALDVGTGNGQCAVSLAARFQQVVASDLSEKQIALAFARNNLRYFVAAAHDSGLPDASVDLVTAATALHWFELDKFFAELKRILKPAGIFAAWSYAWHQCDHEGINQLLETVGKTILADYWSPQPKLIWNNYEAIKIPMPELSAPAFTAESFWNYEEFIGYLSTWSATQKYIESKGRHPAAELEAKIQSNWGDLKMRRKFSSKLVLRIARKSV